MQAVPPPRQRPGGPGTGDRHRGWWRAIAARPAAVAAGAALVLLALVDPHWKTDPDSAGYLSMARSSAARHGLLRQGMRQWYYAPLYPLQISPAFRLGGSPFLWVSVINVLTAAAVVAGTYRWFRRYSRRGAGFVAALVGVNVGLWDVCREPRAETLFTALLVWSAVFLGRAVDGPSQRRLAVDVTVGAALLAATCLTRQVGVFLAAGFALAVTIRWATGRAGAGRLAVAAAVGAVAVAAVATLVVHDRLARRADGRPTAATYTDQFLAPGTTLAGQLVDGLRRQTGDVGRLMLPGMWGSFSRGGRWANGNTIAYLLFSVLVAVGWWRLARRTNDPLAWAVPLYVGVFLVWPFDQGTRFTVPLLPVLWASAWTLVQRWPRRRPVVFAVVLAMHLVAQTAYLVHDRGVVGRTNASIPPLADLLRRVPPADRLAGVDLRPADPLIVAYLRDRPFEATARRDLPAGPGWLLVGPAATRRPSPPPAGFAPVAESQGYRLYRR